MSSLTKKTDTQLHEDVVNELNWDPRVTSTQLAVNANDGIITIRGSVPHYSEKKYAEQAVRRVNGVRAVADEMEVNLPGAYQREDEDIARAALAALDWTCRVPKGVKVSVDRAWITLTGEADWEFERAAATEVVSPLTGVRGVTNDIILKSKELPLNVKTSIEEALKRTAESEGRRIHVSVNGGQVTLTGDVNNYFESEHARIAAWSVTGVQTVDNQLKVAP